VSVRVNRPLSGHGKLSDIRDRAVTLLYRESLIKCTNSTS